MEYFYSKLVLFLVFIISLILFLTSSFLFVCFTDPYSQPSYFKHPTEYKLWIFRENLWACILAFFSVTFIIFGFLSSYFDQIIYQLQQNYNVIINDETGIVLIVLIGLITVVYASIISALVANISYLNCVFKIESEKENKINVDKI